MSVAGTTKELDHIMLLSSVPKLHEAIEKLDGTLVRFSMLVETRMGELKTLVETNVGDSSRAAEALESIEHQLGGVAKNVSRLVKSTREAVRERALDYPWVDSDESADVERRRGRNGGSAGKAGAGGVAHSSESAVPDLESLFLSYLERSGG